ncbi:hypothetical protein CVT25_011746 [Psilocybe cyanescens]|uniref:Uncharacterized protein n=1 Tax=Psilocybe cyanescens TaxID=93625 RepID=A0A409WIF0_PSICY|nr:hypothetical protein CVT25_011746 [Psilocybe cyanescens]
MVPLLALMIPARQHLPTYQIALMPPALLLADALRILNRPPLALPPDIHSERGKRAAHAPALVAPARAERLARPVAQDLLLLHAGRRRGEHLVARHALRAPPASARPHDLHSAWRTQSAMAYRGAWVLAGRVRFGADRVAGGDGCGAVRACRESILRWIGDG